MFVQRYLPGRRRATDVSFGMVVRNGARFMKACLESVSPLCDEIVVVDTGSEDDSRDIARSFGATVIDAAWTNDFAAARNIYVERARCAWILSLDADEVLGRLSKAALTDAVERNPRTAFVFEIRNYFVEDEAPALVLPSKSGSDAPAGTRCVLSRTVRLFPRRPGLRYSYPVHESLGPAIERTGIRIRRCHVPIHHIGGLYGGANAMTKAALYRELGRAKIARHPSYFLGYLELGQLCLWDGDIDEAARLFGRALALRPGCVEARCFVLIALLRQGKVAECRRQLTYAQRRAPENADLRYVHDLLDAAERSVQPSEYPSA
jgi:glycosyltransferase involved in cell wall biosynthesis